MAISQKQHHGKLDVKQPLVTPGTTQWLSGDTDRPETKIYAWTSSAFLRIFPVVGLKSSLIL